jgi:hypothetical protein
MGQGPGSNWTGIETDPNRVAMNWEEYNSRIFYVSQFPEVIQYRICRIYFHKNTRVKNHITSLNSINLTNRRKFLTVAGS